MTNYFQYNTDTSIKAKTQHGVEIVVYFDDKHQPSEITVGDAEWICSDDDLSGIFVWLEAAKPCSLADVCLYAADEWDEIYAQTQRAAQEEAEHERQVVGDYRASVI